MPMGTAMQCWTVGSWVSSAFPPKRAHPLALQVKAPALPVRSAVLDCKLHRAETFHSLTLRKAGVLGKLLYRQQQQHEERTGSAGRGGGASSALGPLVDTRLSQDPARFRSLGVGESHNALRARLTRRGKGGGGGSPWRGKRRRPRGRLMPGRGCHLPPLPASQPRRRSSRRGEQPPREARAQSPDASGLAGGAPRGGCPHLAPERPAVVALRSGGGPGRRGAQLCRSPCRGSAAQPGARPARRLPLQRRGWRGALHMLRGWGGRRRARATEAAPNPPLRRHSPQRRDSAALPGRRPGGGGAGGGPSPVSHAGSPAPGGRRQAPPPPRGPPPALPIGQGAPAKAWRAWPGPARRP